MGSSKPIFAWWRWHDLVLSLRFCLFRLTTTLAEPRLTWSRRHSRNPCLGWRQQHFVGVDVHINASSPKEDRFTAKKPCLAGPSRSTE